MDKVLSFLPAEKSVSFVKRVLKGNILVVHGIKDFGHFQGQLEFLSVICLVLIKYQIKAGLNG